MKRSFAHGRNAMKEIAIAYLKQNPIAHMDLLEGIRRGTSDIRMASSKGVLLQDQKSQVYLLSTEDRMFQDEAFRQIQGAQMVVAHQIESVQRAQELFGYRRCIHCRQAVYEGKRPLAIHSQVRFETLSLSFLPVLEQFYSGHADREYLQGRLEEGVMIGAFLEDYLVGFVGQHEEGSMGLLEVLPEYRGKGFGKALLAAAVNWQLERGQIPYSQIIDGNAKSYKLHQSMGFLITPQVSVYWLAEPAKEKGRIEK